ncbi:MAG TPA: WG repeat-containing protein, partial [Bacteroidia bacterium]|nr:WG repeat-containing protein [Bacteroidia bacterium]
KKDKWGFIDSKIRLVIPYQYDGASSFSDGMARVKSDGNVGMIDVRGKEIIKPQFQTINYLDNYIYVNDGNAWGLMDKKGNWILPCKYSKIEFVDSSMLRVEKNDKFGYYNIARCEFTWKEDGVE